MQSQGRFSPTPPLPPDEPLKKFKRKLMAEITLETIKGHVNDVKKIFADGFQLGDIAAVIKEAMEIAQTYKDSRGLSGPARKELALTIIGQVIDETDLPWLPDPLVDPLLKKLAPNLIDMLVGAANGKLGFGPAAPDPAE